MSDELEGSLYDPMVKGLDMCNPDTWWDVIPISLAETRSICSHKFSDLLIFY
jgi:hypothetical protein